jgi:BON domain-containing protein
MKTHDVRRLRRVGGLAVAAALLCVGPALADESVRAVAAPGVDADIQSEVVDAVLGYVHYGVFDSVGVGVADGVVTLTGSVLQPWHKDDIQKRVARREGVREVKNQIRVQPASIFDDRLRVQLYRQIYGPGMFERYASLANPPIHIVVENGNITLTGLVNSQVEKAVLGSIARGTLAFRVDNQVQVESDLNKEPAKASRPS